MTQDLSQLAMARAIAAGNLQKAWIQKDREAGLRAIADLHAPGLRALLVQGDAGVRTALNAALETSTTAILQWWFSNTDDHSWQILLTPDERGELPLPELASNAAMLRLSDSVVTREPGPPIDPASFAKASPARQARALAHLCLTTDAAAPVDYAALYAATTPELRPFLACWMLGSYLTSPSNRLDSQYAENQTAARLAFTEVHAADPSAIPPSMAYTSTAYRASVDEPDVRPFLSVLDARVLAPALPTEPPSGAGGGTAVFLEACGSGGKLDRRVGRTLDLLCRRGARGVLVTEDVHTAWSSLPKSWQDDDVDVLGLPAASSVAGLAASAMALAAENVDLLVYPQVSLGVASRWLASQRLAEVQVSLAADLTTSGAAAIDYAVIGEDLVGDGEEFSEDVLVIPGLGLDIAEPPRPTAARQRPADDPECLLVATATSEKLSGPLLDLWNAILEQSSGRAALHFFPGLTEAQAKQVATPLAQHFSERVDALLVPTLEREAVVDGLVEADVFLDTFPYGGLHALVEALSTGCPVVTIEGDHLRNRVGAALLRRLELPEFLIAKNAAEYVGAAVRLIQEPNLRAELRSRLTREAVLAALVDPDLPNHVATALDLASRLGARTPGRRSAPRRVYDSTGGARRIAV